MPAQENAFGQHLDREQIVYGIDGLPEAFSIAADALPSWLRQARTAIKQGRVREALSIIESNTLEGFEPKDDSDNYADAAFVLGQILQKARRYEQAEYWYKRSSAIRPHVLVYFSLAEVAKRQGRVWEAIGYIRKALELAPGAQVLHSVLASYLVEAGALEECLDALKAFLHFCPSRAQHTRLLWHMHMVHPVDRAQVFAEHRSWAMQYAPAGLAKSDHTNDPDPDRPLRIGYISPDFYRHSVAYFFESLLDGHDREHFKVIGYGNVAVEDDVTGRFKAKFDLYRNIRPLSDQQVVDLIRKDQIDILVDLAGHTQDNRLSVLAYKPAPIQVSFLGYPDTTGMGQVDYRFTDQWADLPDADQYYSERLIRLPTGFICYRPPRFAPTVGPLPAQANGYVTFCSFNNNAKISKITLDMWAAILRHVPDSRLLLKFKYGSDPVVAQRYINEFADWGIDPGRIRILGFLRPTEHLGLYNHADIALDTYPYHGTTTTCEALWMGVPVVSLVGEHHVSRVGLSLLTRVGLEAFTASTPKEYVAKAIVFAGRLGDLAQMRRNLRKTMATSSLCDYKSYTQAVEQAYRQMWQQWCKQHLQAKSTLAVST
jgi:predicted O-linked N-acetylglucosamine transferase (SPINDLY family)